MIAREGGGSQSTEVKDPREIGGKEIYWRRANKGLKAGDFGASL